MIALVVDIPQGETENSLKIDEKGETVYLCLRCGGMVTYEKEETAVNGSFRHNFTNPHGIMFAIGCFSSAPGCLATGNATDEFTWFPGYGWRIAGCGSCGFHLGWEFSRGESVFFGLILDNLRRS